MIEIFVEPSRLVAEVSEDVVVRVTNTGPHRCFLIFIEIDLGLELVMERGASTFELDELVEGAVHEHRVRLFARKPGRHVIHIPNFSYRDRFGLAQRVDEPPIQIMVESPVSVVEDSVEREDHRDYHLPNTVFPTVFISHRRAESRWFVNQFFGELIRSLPRSRVFMDKQGIAAGENFRERIDIELFRSRALLALIGDQWQSVARADGKIRIMSDDDLVRYEIATALSRGILVMPVLFNDARMPHPTVLPPDLTKLADLNETVIGERTLKSDVRGIVRRLTSRGFR
ncbi:TIR domain-containing protein [Pseudonocardia xinjiangensis]|uniref:TIR domain-containing protein n=1 Tax=Pseudonocardia xinjiangensis TaxID=75289 RepID=UPI003D8C1948